MVPVTSIIPTESTVRFVVEIPDVHQVAVFSSQYGKTTLSRNDRGLWKADVDTGEGNQELELRAEIKKGSNLYTRLLKYQVPYLINNVNNHQRGSVTVYLLKTFINEANVH